MQRTVIPIIVALLVATLGAALAADVAEDDVLLKVEIENWGKTSGMQPMAHDEASGGIAMSLAADAVAVGGLELGPGDYTLLFYDHAPAGDQDAFFVEIQGERTPLEGPHRQLGHDRAPVLRRKGRAGHYLGHRPGARHDPRLDGDRARLLRSR